MLIIAVITIWPQFIDYTAATYTAEHIKPERNKYCPGDKMNYEVTIEKRRPGVINIVETWCRVGGFCAVSQTVEETSIIPYASPPLTVTAERIIPNLRTMEPGQKWILAHVSYALGHEDDAEMYEVFITLADDCEAWAE